MNTVLAHRIEAVTATRTTVLARPVAAVETAMHPHVYGIALVCWLSLLAIFWITFWVSANALFMVTIGTFYAAMFFGVPYQMSRMAGIRPAKTSLERFLRGRFATIDGPISGSDALLQVILVPGALVLGGSAIGFIISWARTLY